MNALPTVDDYKAGKVKPADRMQVDRWRWEGLQVTNWRRDSQLDHDYYDGNQMSAQVLQDMEDRGIPAIVCNLTGPTIDLVLGMEAQSRTDWICRPNGNDPRWDDLAQAMSQEINEAERMSGADEACSGAAANQFKGGIGWVEVKREADPFKYRYNVAKRDWREFWLDPFSTENNVADARYLRRAKFYDRDLLCKMFADKAYELHNLNYGSSGPTLGSDRSMTEAEMYSRGSIGPWRDYSLTELDWLDVDRDRLQLEEIWYRTPVRGEVIRLRDGSVYEFNPKDPMHAMALERRIATLQKAVWSVMRVGFWVGPLCLQDIPSPYPHRNFPYVPFWGYREDRTGIPYGLIRRMRAPQDEVNARRSKMLWGLSARRVFTTPKGTPDHDLARQEVARPDSYIIISDEPNQQFKVDDNIGINDQQFKAYLDARQMLQDSGGVYQSMLGKQDSGADSGVAIASLVEQGTTTLATLYTNTRRGRTCVGDLLMSLVVEDMAGVQKDIVVQKRDGARKRVIVNKPTMANGMQTIENDVTKAKLNVVLDEVPQSPSFRMQQLKQVTQALSRLPPEAQLQTLDMVVELFDLPNKAEFVKRVREMMGRPPDVESMSDDERQQYEAAQQEMAEQKDLQKRGIAAKVALDEAKVQQVNAEAQAALEEVRRTMAEIKLLAAKIKDTNIKAEQSAQDMRHQEMAITQSGPPTDQRVQYRW